MPLPTTYVTPLRSISRFTRPALRFTPASARFQHRLQPLTSIRRHSSESPSPPSELWKPVDTSTPSTESKPYPAHGPRRRSRDSSNIPYPTKPTYEMTFTCTPCSTRSTHSVSKQGYHYGSVLITCPGCRNRHVISDHLGIFGDKHMTVEDLMKEQGKLVKRGTLSEDGDIEFWADGTTTKRGEGAGVVGEMEEGSEKSP